MAKVNPFAKFELATKEITVKALGDAKVTIREMNVGDSNRYYTELFLDVDEEGKPKVSTEFIIRVKMEKVSKCMVEPEMSIDELQALGAKAGEAIGEIADAIDELSNEGN